jgi:hypothetical protein
MSITDNWSQLKIIEYPNKKLIDEIKPMTICELHMTDKKQ